MNNLLRKVTKLLLGLSLAAGVGVAIGSKKADSVYAADATVTFGSQGWSNSSQHNDFTLSGFRFLKGGSGTAATYYTSDSTLRYYNNDTLTITPSNANWSISAVTSNPSQTFTVTSSSATLSFSATVKFKSITITYTTGSSFTPDHAGTQGDPYSVADAIGAIDASTGTSNVYVGGIVCNGGSSLSSGALNYYISDDGTTTTRLEIYKGKGISGANFTSTDDIKVGDIVVVYGSLTKYNSTYEFSQGSNLISLVRKLTVTYDGNGSDSGSVPTDSTKYESGNTVTVLGNTNSLGKTGYVFSGWTDGTNTYDEGDTFTMPSTDVTLSAVWVADSLQTLTISGSMSKTSYSTGDSWSPAGLVVTATFLSGATNDVSSLATFSYYNSSDEAVASPNALGVGSNQTLKVTATYGGITTSKYVASNVIEVFVGVTYDLETIDGFSGWNSTYGSRSLTEASFDPAVATAASLEFLITNKQSSGVGSTYPCIGGKTNSEVTCLTFTLNESGKKISSVSITFVTRYTSTFPSLYLHKGNGIATSALSSLTMSGSTGDEHSLSYSNLNDTVFTVGYNAHQTGSNGAVGIKSITIGLANQASFGTLDHISVTGLPNTVYHVGESFDSTGFAVTAYDGPEESTANFKDVTANVSTDFDGGYTFSDSDVPGFDCDVEYSGDGGSDTTSFHVDVYALAEYVLVTSEPADWSGNYLIVGTKENSDLAAMNGGLSNPDSEAGYKVVSDTSGTIEAGQELEWVIAPVTGGYSIQGKSGKYIGSLTSNSNGMLVSDTALVNTLSYEDGATIIAGNNSNHYHLTFNNSGDRFRYYSSGSVQLYKLKESSNAIAYAETFLAAFTCDATGENAPTFTIKEGSTYWSWSLLATEYNTLTAVEKEEFRLGAASESGDEIAQALARYDYVVGKYGTSTYSDFMLRNPAQIGGVKLAFNAVNENTNTIAIIVTISLVSVTAIGGYFFIKRREQN